MRAEVNGQTKQASRLWTRAFWLCILAVLLTTTLTLKLGSREIHAQAATPAQATPSHDSTQANSPAGTDSQVPTADQQAKKDNQPKPDDHAAVTDPKKKAIADQGASLLKLASSLKADVDKTTPDTLSVSVIREADEIEKLAHKMRTK